MKRVTGIEILPASGREVLPGSFADYAHVASRAEIDRYLHNGAPWHWHDPVELFYIESGALEYTTPGARLVFPAGSGGLVNSGVLHMTRSLSDGEATVQLVHLFDPQLISGGREGRLYEKYVLPLLSSGCEIFALPEDADLMNALRTSFALDEQAYGHELRLRAALTEIWLQLAHTVSRAQDHSDAWNANGKLKRMMLYVHENYARPLRVEELAAAAYISQRECYRLFRSGLHCSPLEYITRCRLQAAALMLSSGGDGIAHIAQNCGFATSSHFGKLFSGHYGCTPGEYRRRWQDRDIKGRK